ncbi:DUF4167 domain-containing protein [Pseudogemmobacter sonorensis]|uniref:DUF4167 domain-containing protein n=1 Tax=Pseudogemmobacter sonorensis TaxID=2989681 RepID=UPI003F66C2FB
MRSSKKRSRSNQNRPRSLGNIVNRVFDSSGPEGKVRGTPQQIIEKYQTLARDAQLSNDRVAAENFLQHAEHYTRMLAEAQRELAAEHEARQGQQNGGGQNGNQNGNRDNAGRDANRDNLNRDRAERNDSRERGDRGFERQDPRPPGTGEQPGETPADVIDFGNEDAGLVELPEAPRAERGPERRNDRRDRQNFRRDRDDRRREGGAEAAQTPAPGPRPEAVSADGGESAADLPSFITGLPGSEPGPESGPEPRAEGRAPRAASRAEPKAAKAKADLFAAEAPAASEPAPAAGEAAGGAAGEAAGEPEAKPRRPRAPRKPREKAAADPVVTVAGSDGSE